MKIAIITDTHFGIKNDAQYVLDYQEKFYKDIFFPHLIEHNIKQVFHLGDFFDRRKYVNFGTLSRTKKMFFDALHQNGINLTIIPGNHCVFHKNTNEVNSIDLLMSEYQNVNQLHGPSILEFDKVKFMFIPWINNENYKSTMEYINSNDADILCAHLELNGFAMHAGHTCDTGMNTQPFAKFHAVLSGHFHHKSSKENIHYLGAPMEFTWSDYDDPRGFHIFDTETKGLTFVQNPYKLYEKYYYNDETPEAIDAIRNKDVSEFAEKIIRLYVIKKTKPAIFESFIDSIYKQPLHDFTIMEDFSEFHESNVDIEIEESSTKELMDKYVDGVDTDMNKLKIKSILNNLYVEALHLD